MKRLFFLISVLFQGLTVSANDSAKILSPGAFFEAVKKYHPVSRQAGLQVDKAAAALTAARGGFDPVLGIGGSNKTFNGINYYQNSNAQVSIPTWYGIEAQAGQEYLSGSRTDPRETPGKNSFAGISIPLAKNLLMDKRRAALQQAKIMARASEQEKRAMLNDLLMDASEAYWQWVKAWLVYKTYDEVIGINKKRMGLVVQAWRNGERPAIDTTEALVQLQNIGYQQNEALLAWQNAGVSLNNFLWKENDQAWDLPGDVTPGKKTTELIDDVVFPELEQLINEAKANHPELSIYAYKLEALNIEKKLKFQELLPKLDLKYNFLGKGYDIASAVTRHSFDNNYRYGIGFSMPLRISQGRGEYKMAKLKITETRLQQTYKEMNIINKVKSYYNELVNQRIQLGLLQNAWANSLRLQKGEEIRFFNGESNLFLVNSRENKTLEMMVKLTEVAAKYNKTFYALRWAAGDLWKL